MTLDTDTLGKLADRLVKVQLALQPLRDEEAALKAQIRELLAAKGPGKYAAGGHVVNAQATRRLDLDAIAKAYPANERPSLYTLKPDTKKVRASLPPDEIEQYMVTGGDLKIGLEP